MRGARPQARIQTIKVRVSADQEEVGPGLVPGAGEAGITDEAEGQRFIVPIRFERLRFKEWIRETGPKAGRGKPGQNGVT